MRNASLWLSLLGLLAATPLAAALEPAFGRNCLACHGQLQMSKVRVVNEDTWADPNESQTGAPDRGLLKCFQVYRGQAKTLQAEVLGLSLDDAYAVELWRMHFRGVEQNGQLLYSGDCDWPEWGEAGRYYTDPIVAYQWGSGPTAFEFEISVAPNADADYYDLVFAVAGRFELTGELFYGQEHFYLHVRGRAGDMNCDERVDFADINPFVLALIDPDSYRTRYAGCNWYNADCNKDGLVDFRDINPFIDLLTP